MAPSGAMTTNGCPVPSTIGRKMSSGTSPTPGGTRGEGASDMRPACGEHTSLRRRTLDATYFDGLNTPAMKINPDAAGLDARQLERIEAHLQRSYLDSGK